jgi:hypothetical protein
MKAKSLFFVIIIALVTLASAACSTKAPVYAAGDQKDQAVAAADPIAKDILDGMQQNNYSLFTKDFDDTMLKAMPETSFNKMVTQFSAFGTLKSSELINVQIVDTYYRINYKLTYEKKVITMGLVIPQSGDVKATGLWFN